MTGEIEANGFDVVHLTTKLNPKTLIEKLILRYDWKMIEGINTLLEKVKTLSFPIYIKQKNGVVLAVCENDFMILKPERIIVVAEADFYNQYELIGVKK